MSKKIGIIAGIVLVAVVVVLIACNRSNSKVFELQEGEAEALGVVFPEKPGDYAKLYHQYEKDGEYEKMIVMAKAMDDYSSLETAYKKAGKYEEALIVIDKLIEIEQNEDGNDLRIYWHVLDKATLLELIDKQDQAIKTLKDYQKTEDCQRNQDCPKSIEQLVSGIEKAKSEGKKFLPDLSR